jgi:hypothetical protein
MKTITVVSNDKVGLLADISYVLGKARVNIESISGDVVSDKSIIVLSLSDADKGKNVLENSGYEVAEKNSIVVKLRDEPGELARITDMLSREKVNIGNVHMLSKDPKDTVLSIEVDRPRRATTLLQQYMIGNEE